MRRMIIAIGLIAICSGCMNTRPSAGDRMIGHAEGTEALGRQWNDGARRAEQAMRVREHAQHALSSAEDELPLARAALVTAERDLAQAKGMMRDAEAEYPRRFPGRSLREQEAASR